MSVDTSQRVAPREAWVIRLGALFGLLGLLLSVVASFALTPPPSPAGDARPEEIAAFFADHADSTGLGHGLRNLAFFLHAVFAVGLYTLIARTADPGAKAWGILALVASAAVLAVGTVNNGVATAAFVDLPVFAEHPELRLLLWDLSYVVFMAARLEWAGITTGFSIAGWQSGALPRWLCFVGLIAGFTALVTVVAIVQRIEGGWPGVFATANMPAQLVFYIGVCVQMLRRAAG